jgi:PAS domain S-box-containing protein
MFNVIGLSAAVAIVIGVRLHQPAYPLPWYLFAVGQTLFVGGDVIAYNYQQFFHQELPFPSIADVLYLAVYPMLVAGLFLLVRRRSPGKDRASLIDSLILTVGAGLLSWVFLMAPYAHDPKLDLSRKLISIAYPLMDLLLLSVAVRLSVGAGTKDRSFQLMMVSVIGLFTTDSVYGWILLHGNYQTGGLLDIGWILFYVLWGAAALHPSMRSLDERATERAVNQPRRRLMLLASASLMAPGVQLVQSIRHEAIDGGILASGSAVLFVLVLVRLNGLMVDINEHRRTERRLRETEAKYRSLVEGLPAVVYLAEFGDDGRWLYVGPQVESILGFSHEEWMANPQLWREHVHPEDQDQVMLEERRALDSGERMKCEYRIVRSDGRLVWIRDEADVLRDDDGNPTSLQGVMYDVTEQKLAESQLLKAWETEKEAAARLRALHEMQNSFLQAVSHDLRTPLTSILGGALTLEQSNGDLTGAVAMDLVGRIASNARKLSRLLTNLLDLDRMSRGILAPNRADVDVARILSNVLEECAVDTHQVELVNPEPALAYVDAAQLERIVENLVTNAIRYTPPGTPIWVGATVSDDGVLVVVEDAGPGVPAELRETVFEPFRQGSEVIEHSPSVGIGLSLVSRFADLHGGRAWVEEREGGGASFKVYLPFASAAEAMHNDDALQKAMGQPGLDEEPMPFVWSTRTSRTA